MNIFDKLFDKIETNDVVLTGMSQDLLAIYISLMFQKNDKSILIVTSSLMEANNLLTRLNNYVDSVFLLPMDDFLTSEAIAISPDLMITRLETLEAIVTLDKAIVITNLTGYLHFLPAKKVYLESRLILNKGLEISPMDLASKLLRLGFHRETLVTQTGEFGVRGYVIDLFPTGEDHPIRLEFFGDEIESIRIFDEQTQKSLQEIDKISVNPCWELLSEKEIPEEKQKSKYLKEFTQVESISDYLNEPFVIYKDINNIKVNYKNLVTDMLEYRAEKDHDFEGNYMYDFDDVYQNDAIFYSSLDNIFESNRKVFDYNCKNITTFHENSEAIEKYIRDSLSHGKTVIVCLKKYQLESLSNKLNLSYVQTDLKNISENKLNLVCFDMSSGFLYQDFVFLTSSELFNYNSETKKYKTKFKYGSKITDINKLSIGDYVVHQTCGIGIYNGFKTLKQGDLLKDYIEILYQHNDKLYIPVEKIDYLSKFTGKEGIVPKVNQLGSTQWQKTKLRVKNKIRDIADQLLLIQAKRESQKGFAFSKDNELQQKFEEAFIYEPTNDQLLSIDQIKKDMEDIHPMDRLLIGDVGFGKTEVAFRAAFKAIMDSKQVLFLCPTTILAKQHYDNALVRFADFPVQIGLLNRFTLPNEKKRILEELSNGTIDMVIGTHRLLSDDVKPKDLGLLIIDEEQRFGVAHKEKIKKYKSNIDVLTLTATPIPRTLQLSIVGLRSLSIIETPPVNRYPVQTYVIEENKQLIREAIYKELSRDGQVFLLYNNVEKILDKVHEIQQLVPEARVIYAHGQMSKDQLETEILKFTEHEADILICTTIIETGIDMPNVNTLIILNADRFGLSQLYQIRGRVGRSNKIAYCYLMYQPNKILTEAATKRLNVIKEFTSLGSGFSIANRDLSIRGAGDILGAEQAGFIDSVGFDLYMKLLNQEVKRLKGEEVEEDDDLDVKAPIINVSTHISDDYIQDVDLKIEVHRLINQIDSFEKLKQIKNELEDRFGKVDENTLIYMYTEWLEKLVDELSISSVKQTKNSIELHFSKEITSKLNVDDIFVLAFKITPMFRFKSIHDNLIIILDTIKLDKHPVYYLTELLSQIKDNMSTT